MDKRLKIHKKGEDLQDEIRLLRQYTYSKLNRIEKCLDMVMQFARDDLKRIDELEKQIKSSNE